MEWGSVVASSETEYTIPDGNFGVGGSHIDVIGFDPHSFLGLKHGNRSCPRKQLREHALMVRAQMLDDYESQASVPRQIRQ